MGKKDETFYFDLSGGNRSQAITLHSGKRVMFYRGKPERNPITDVRDVLQLRNHGGFAEVVKVKRGFVLATEVENTDKSAATTDSLRQAKQIEAQTGDKQPANAKPATKPAKPKAPKAKAPKTAK